MPSLEFRISTSRMLVELNQYKMAVKLLDSVIQENDENPEVWYNLAFSHYHLKKYRNAKECLKNVKTVMLNLKIND